MLRGTNFQYRTISRHSLRVRQQSHANDGVYLRYHQSEPITNAGYSGKEFPIRTEGILLYGLRVRVRTRRETAGPSTALGSDRDDKFVGRKCLKSGHRNGCRWSHRIVIPTGAYPDFLLRGSRQGRVWAFP
jgi:hypothetical protein